ncbi:phosphoribosylamine--glycine ligase [Vagococcus silagei]|uniref:phosphoribosylamine--glycine ligase n=1 Tax=Vagococcus silagei TaxID=2508885 RepID=UPI0026C47E61
MLKILVVGSGGREHALCKKLLQSPRVATVFCAQGNPGMSRDGITCVDIAELAFADLITFCQKEAIDFTIVGPELPLSRGIVDTFRAAGLAIFGPTKEAAQLEASKSFAKELMAKYNIPTAKFKTFTDYHFALNYVEQQGLPIVLKEDGLASGKGVLIAETLSEAQQFLEKHLVTCEGKVVIEEFLVGEECSLLAFVSETGIYPMLTARDHKPLYDGNHGPNTGGMGAYSPIPELDKAAQAEIVQHIVEPTVLAMASEGIPFTGILYTGLILTETGAKVIEYNARFGDPEAQVLLQQLDSDLASVIEALLQQKEPNIIWNENEVTLGVVVANANYPQNCSDSIKLSPLIIEDDAMAIFYSGVCEEEGELYSKGGRIFMVSATKPTLLEARETVYDWLQQQNLAGFYYRHDLGLLSLETIQ